MTGNSKNSLIERVQQGDDAALTELYDHYSALVYSVALRVLHDPSSAEDVLQDVFLTIWRFPERYILAGDRLAGFLGVTARNRSIDMLRRSRPAEPIEDYLLASTFDLACHAERNLLLEKARVVIGEFSQESQQLLDMAFFEGMSHSEISAITGYPLGTVKSRIRSALLTLRIGFQSRLRAA